MPIGIKRKLLFFLNKKYQLIYVPLLAVHLLPGDIVYVIIVYVKIIIILYLDVLL